MKILLHKRIKATVLLYTLGICLLIGFALTFMVLFFSYKSLYREQLQISERLSRNASSGIQLLCSDVPVSSEPAIVDLFNEGLDSVLLKKMNWGVYDVLVSEARFKGKAEQVMALSAHAANPEQQIALYVSDLDKVLSAAGKTKVEGSCYLPKIGIKPGLVEGNSFSGEKIVYGSVKTSATQVPDLDKKWLENLYQLSKREWNQDLEKALLPMDSLKRSFNEKTLLIEEQGTLRLQEVHLKGNMIITASKKIIVSADAQLQDVMLIAPYIIFEKDFRGHVQAIARDTIITEKNVKLQYPSSLSVINFSLKDQAPYISIGEDNQFIGVALTWQKDYDIRYQPKLMIGKKSEVRGQLYSNGYVGLNDNKIIGSVFAHRLLLNTGSSTYENTLYNTNINFEKLPQPFAGLYFDKSTSLNYVAKWLN